MWKAITDPDIWLFPFAHPDRFFTPEMIIMLVAMGACLLWAFRPLPKPPLELWLAMEESKKKAGTRPQ